VLSNVGVSLGVECNRADPAAARSKFPHAFARSQAKLPVSGSVAEQQNVVQRPHRSIQEMESTRDTLNHEISRLLRERNGRQ